MSGTTAQALLAARVGAVELPPARRFPRPPSRRPTFGPDVVCVAVDHGVEAVIARLQRGAIPARLVWAAAAPRASYGDALVDRLLAAGCGLTVWDTLRFGRPDLVRLAYAAHRSAGRAMVACATDGPDLVRALRSRNVPAFVLTADLDLGGDPDVAPDSDVDARLNLESRSKIEHGREVLPETLRNCSSA